MFRDLARCTARLKGARYDGAVIAAAAWSRAGNGRALAADALPDILVDRHRMMRVQASDASGTLTLTMLLGRKAPTMRAGQGGMLQLTAEAEGVADGAEPMNLTFSAEDVQSFVHAVDDTNPLHEGTRPLVPGLLIMERLLKALKSNGCERFAMKFTTPVFVGQEVVITFAGGSRAKG